MPDKNGNFTLEELQHPTTPLARHYAEKLPKYGWAGGKTKAEKEYIRWFKEKHKAHLSPLSTIKRGEEKGNQ